MSVLSGCRLATHLIFTSLLIPEICDFLGIRTESKGRMRTVHANVMIRDNSYYRDLVRGIRTASYSLRFSGLFGQALFLA